MSLADAADRLIGTIEHEHMKGRLDLTSEGGEFEGVILDAPVVDHDFSRVFRIFKQDPNEFDIVDDTVRMSTWQQSRRTESGDRDLVQLYSYSARFQRKPKQRLSDTEIEKRRVEVRKWKIAAPRKRVDKNNSPVAAVINLADIQGGKSEGGGVDGADHVHTQLATMTTRLRLPALQRGAILANHHGVS